MAGYPNNQPPAYYQRSAAPQYPQSYAVQPASYAPQPMAQPYHYQASPQQGYPVGYGQPSPLPYNFGDNQVRVCESYPAPQRKPGLLFGHELEVERARIEAAERQADQRQAARRQAAERQAAQRQPDQRQAAQRRTQQASGKGYAVYSETTSVYMRTSE